MLGYRRMLDGGGNELIVTRAENRFAGRWESSIGPTTSRRRLFCAQRRSTDN
jgi:hypothetical protein